MSILIVKNVQLNSIGLRKMYSFFHTKKSYFSYNFSLYNEAIEIFLFEKIHSFYQNYNFNYFSYN